jgi:hypothetical protein
MTITSGKLTGLFVSAAVGAGAAGIVLGLAGVTSPVRVVLVLVFIAVVPAAAIAGLLRGFDRFARLVLAGVTATAVVVLIAMAMLAAGLWSPTGGLIAIAAFSAVCWLAQRVPFLRAAVVACAAPVRRTLIRYGTDGGRKFQADGAQPTAAKLGQGGDGPVSVSASGRGGAVDGPAGRPSGYGWSAAAADDDTIELHPVRAPGAAADPVMASANGGSRPGSRGGAVDGLAGRPSGYGWSAAAADDDTVELHPGPGRDAITADLAGPGPA